ncbi:ABC transporter A family member 2-like [Silene latifolia]|uniref:ABC transporter A family member 2-like n=1 Tax=Silene latifolia TaxID=37657 RepID=UPI003D77B0E3
MGLLLLLQQWKGLTKKNMLMCLRNKRATLLQFLAPFITMFILYLVSKAASLSASQSDRPLMVVQSIPPCETKFYVRQPCFDFVWSGNSSVKAIHIVSRIMANNPGRPIPSHKVKSFGTPAEVDAWLLDDPLRCPASLHLFEKNASVTYGIQANLTQSTKRGTSENPTLKFLVPLQVAAEREIARSILRDPNFRWTVGLKEFPRHEVVIDKYTMDGFVVLAPLFLYTIAMFPFVLQLSSIVLEKEQRLRQAMNIMGLYDSAYWLSFLTWESIVISVNSLLTLFSGMIFQFDLFLHNSFAVLFLVFFLYQLSMTGVTFFLSPTIQKSSSALTTGIWIYLVGAMLQFVPQVIQLDFQNGSILLYSLPPTLLAYTLNVLIKASKSHNDPGISLSELTPIYSLFIFMFVCSLLWGLYYDNVIPSPNGTRKTFLYFLSPRYWTGSGENNAQVGIHSHNISTDEDVVEEENTVKQQMSSGELDPNVAVQIRGLVKTYLSQQTTGGCFCQCICFSFRCSMRSQFHAIKGLYVNLVKDQLFCLLGPNGAGKTTTINCLTGITAVTGGDVIVYGNSIRSSVEMSNIRKMIGVCPQYDILWNGLTGEEHLQLFASIKGLQPASIKQAVKKSLQEVRLLDSAKVRAGSYSRGMKRRLSIASALLGDPKLIILDEPTTGMDPVSRRQVWDIIENAKNGRTIILTTHSMEEADVLGDRIGVMAKGRLHCIGTSIRLKSRFGTGFIINLSFTDGNSAENSANIETVKSFFRQHLEVSPKKESHAFLSFIIPRQKEDLLKRMFGEFQDKQEEFGVADIQLGLTNLEEVFLNISRQAELESSASEGRFVAVTLTSGTSMKMLIPVGARHVGIPGTANAENPNGVMVEIYWEQDESGNLCISGHSPATPVPPNVQLTLPAAVPPPRNLGRRDVFGLLIDPSQLLNSNVDSQELGS